jgi:diguanylate cyclase
VGKPIGKHRSETGGASDVGQRVLAFLAAQGLAPTPENYALGYLVRTEPNGLIAAAVDAILLAGRALNAADAKRILAMRAAAEKPASGADSHDAMLRAQTIKLSDLASGAAERTKAFGLDLSSNLAEIADCTPVVAKLIDAMIARTEETETQLRVASREIEVLRGEVEAVKGDATRDALTGLLNRRGAMERLRSLDARSSAWLAIADVDHFKAINDRLGHSVGDRVLTGVATSFAQSCGEHVVARWGGEEFLIIMLGVDDDEAHDVCEDIRDDLARRSFRLRSSDRPIGQVTVSIGAAAVTAAGVDDALELADRNLYAAKRSGRNRVVSPVLA